MLISIDSGGTFTDCVYAQADSIQVLKVFSTPDDPSRAVREAVHKIAGTGLAEIRHGTTVGTNALLERKLARVAFVTTAGFEDSLSIGRQNRPDLYDWLSPGIAGIVSPDMCFGIRERTAPSGQILVAPTGEALLDLVKRVAASGAESIAVSLLFSFANPTNEQRVVEALQSLKLPISAAHRILPVFREYERASTIAVNAALRPKVGPYLETLDRTFKKTEIMMSSGGIASAKTCAHEPVRTVLSGPAGGAMGAYFISLLAGFEKVLTCDMGGTSTDVSLFNTRDGPPPTTNESVVSNIPVAVPMLDIVTVGAGGGSIAHFDGAGMLHVGPQSAGANPGPICYGRGELPTVSDANLILGRLDAEHFLGGGTPLDSARAERYMNASRASMSNTTDFARGIVSLAETAIERAIRVVSVERGHDPRDFTLLAFGGAGPLHACALANKLRIPRVLIPTLPGALSALGIRMCANVRDYSRTVMLDATADLESHFNDLYQAALADAGPDAQASQVHRSLDLRYAGQGWELNVEAGPAAIENFHQAHERRYGYADRSRPLEIVNLCLRLTLAPAQMHLPEFPLKTGNGAKAVIKRKPVVFENATADTPVYQRELLEAGEEFSGPAIVVEYSATTVIPPGWRARLDRFHNLILEANA